MLIGYARCSTEAQDLTAQHDALTTLGVKPNRIYVDHGLTGTNRARLGLREALAACRAGDTLVVTKLDRLARSLTDARNIVEELTTAGIKLNIGGSVHDPTDPVGRLLFNVLAMIAEFESDLIRMRTRKGMKVAKAKGRLRGKQPKLKPAQEAHLVELWHAGKHTSAELAELFSVARFYPVYRAVRRAGAPKPVRGLLAEREQPGTRSAPLLRGPLELVHFLSIHAELAPRDRRVVDDALVSSATEEHVSDPESVAILVAYTAGKISGEEYRSRVVAKVTSARR